MQWELWEIAVKAISAFSLTLPTSHIEPNQSRSGVSWRSNTWLYSDSGQDPDQSGVMVRSRDWDLANEGPVLWSRDLVIVCCRVRLVLVDLVAASLEYQCFPFRNHCTTYILFIYSLYICSNFCPFRSTYYLRPSNILKIYYRLINIISNFSLVRFYNMSHVLSSYDKLALVWGLICKQFIQEARLFS